MSNHKNTKSQSATDDTVDQTTEEIFVGAYLDEDGHTIETKSNPIASFLKRHKTWFIAGGAVTAGFILHGFLGRPDDCVVDYDDDSGELEYDDTSNTETE